MGWRHSAGNLKDDRRESGRRLARSITGALEALPDEDVLDMARVAVNVTSLNGHSYTIWLWPDTLKGDHRG